VGRDARPVLRPVQSSAHCNYVVCAEMSASPLVPARVAALELAVVEQAAAELAALPPGRRERKKLTTRMALKAAAIDLVGERGYSNVTVEDIADAADVSVRTFFNYFASKEAAVVGNDPEIVEEMCLHLAALPHGLTPLETLRTVLLERIRAIGETIDLSGEEHGVWLRRVAVVRSQPEVLLAYTKHLAMVERALADALVEWLGGDEELRSYAALVTTCAMGVLRVAICGWGGEGGAPSLVAFADSAFELLGRGLPLGVLSIGEAAPTTDDANEEIAR